jgi:lipopolysaccharide transport protein LptA
MIAPVMIGAALLVAAPFLLEAPLPLHDLREIAGAQTPVAPPPPAVATVPAIDLWPVASLAIAALYLAGLGACAVKLIRARARLARIEAASVPTSALGEGVRLADKACTPFASARGAIVLPRALVEALGPGELAMIARHERAHIDRGDPRAYSALAWIDALFWPNPFVRQQTRRCRLAAEIACDAAVIASELENRAAYAGALVAAIRHATGKAVFAPGMFSSRSNGEHHVRLTRIMNDATAARSRFGRVSIAAAALLILPVAGLQLVACVSGPSADFVAALPSGPTDISARSVDVHRISVGRSGDKSEEVGVWNGNVQLRRGDVELDADSVEVHYAGADKAKEIDRVVATGSVVYITPQQSVRGDRALYTAGDNRIRVSGHVKVEAHGQSAAVSPSGVANGAHTFALMREPGDRAPPVASSGRLVYFLSESGRPDRIVPPIEGQIQSGYGERLDPQQTVEPARHDGVDFAAPAGTPVVAAASGFVTYVGERGGYGLVVEIDHGNGYETRSAHLSSAAVAKGDKVATGQAVGVVGSSGRVGPGEATAPLLHWEVWRRGVVQDPTPLLAALGVEAPKP